MPNPPTASTTQLPASTTRLPLDWFRSSHPVVRTDRQPATGSDARVTQRLALPNFRPSKSTALSLVAAFTTLVAS